VLRDFLGHWRNSDWTSFLTTPMTCIELRRIKSLSPAWHIKTTNSCCLCTNVKIQKNAVMWLSWSNGDILPVGSRNVMPASTPRAVTESITAQTMGTLPRDNCLVFACSQTRQLGTCNSYQQISNQIANHKSF